MTSGAEAPEDMQQVGALLVLIVAPCASRTAADVRARLRIERDLVARGRLPVFAPALLEDYLVDDVPGQRALALALSAALARTVAVAGGTCVVVGLRRTEGMLADLAAWRSIEGAPEPDVAGA